MSDPLTLGLASTAVGLVNSTISLFKQVNDSAKNSDDIDLKRGLSDLYGQIVELKAQILDLVQENADLNKQLSEQASMKWNSRFGYYFQEGDPIPFCPACWDLNKKLIHLRPDSMSRPPYRYDCNVCRNTYMESD
jgi:hypothetical protein